ncbi:FeoA family protein [Acinetobacter pullicarnis]|uniref:FeoA family protein n=1 Tax=Acinetobacter pullicarnis TaxID=2576829 RepID=UPI00111DEF57|nr:FeoA family protein [Acinetobacter pullicarnis]
MRLSELSVKQTAIVTKVNRDVEENGHVDLIASRLETLGFVQGTRVRVITKGFFGGDPILIQVGFTRFALRKVEAEKIEISQENVGASS